MPRKATLAAIVALLAIAALFANIVNVEEADSSVGEEDIQLVTVDPNRLECPEVVGVNGCVTFDRASKQLTALVYAGGKNAAGMAEWKACPREACGRFSYIEDGAQDMFEVVVRASRNVRVVGGTITTQSSPNEDCNLPGSGRYCSTDVLSTMGRPFRSNAFNYQLSDWTLYDVELLLRVRGVRPPHGAVRW